MKKEVATFATSFFCLHQLKITFAQ